MNGLQAVAVIIMYICVRISISYIMVHILDLYGYVLRMYHGAPVNYIIFIEKSSNFGYAMQQSD